MVLIVGFVQAEPPIEGPPLTLRLVSEITEIQPGRVFTVALELKHAEGHHSYWKFPGIVGVPTSITWKLPKGFSAAPIQWPIPEKVDMRGHGAYGFHHDTLLLVDVTPPMTLEFGKEITLAGRVGYMGCSQQRCVPGFEDVTLTLKVGNELRWDAKWRPEFQKTRAQFAKEIPGWRAELTEAEEYFELVVKAPDETTTLLPDPEHVYFYSANGFTASDKPHLVKKDGSVYRFQMPKHPFPDENEERFQGILASEKIPWLADDHNALGLWVDLPLKAVND